MDLWTALFTVFRRWYVSLPIAVLAVVATIMIGGRIEQEYEAKASVVLVPAEDKVIGGIRQPAGNPYDPRSAASAVYRRISSTDMQRQFQSDGFSKNFTVALDQNAAIIDFVVTGAGADEALTTAERLIDETRSNLARIQQAANVEDDARISLSTIDLSQEAEPVKGNKPRVMATVFVLGMVAAASAAFIVESFGSRRRSRDVGVVPGAGVPVLPGYAPYAPIPGAVAPAGYMPVVPLPTAPVPTETMPTETMPTETMPTETMPTETVPTVVAQPPVAEPRPAATSSSGGSADLYGSVDDLLDEADGPSTPQPVPASPPRNGAKSIDGGRRRTGQGRPGAGAGSGNGSPATDSAERPTRPGNGRPSGSGSSGPSRGEIAGERAVVDLNEAARRDTPTPDSDAASKASSRVLVEAKPDVRTQPDTPSASPSNAQDTARDSRPSAASPTAAASAPEARPTPTEPPATKAPPGQKAPGQEPRAPKAPPAPPRVADETAGADTPADDTAKLRPRDGGKGRRASLFSAPGDATPDKGESTDGTN